MSPKTEEKQGDLRGQREPKRTTVLLRPEDQENLETLARLQGGIPDGEAIRRSLNLAKELLEWVKLEGGQIVLEKGRQRERIRFL